jgi:phosphate transport system substrate-binding protein
VVLTPEEFGRPDRADTRKETLLMSFRQTLMIAVHRAGMAACAAAIAVAATPGLAAGQLLMNGAGATFPYPLYSKWFDEYTKVDPAVRFNYQSIGSGGGIRQISERTVDFGASDGPMTDEQLKKAPGELFHIPTVLGAVAATYSLPGAPRLQFTGDVLADIFLGRITRWDDGRIKALNAGVSLPGQPIVVVHRSDGSGTTYIWVDYLSKVSAEWQQRVGRGTSVNWPVGLGGKGNEGVAGQVKNTPGALGYVELAYAITNKLPVASVKNAAGRFIEPSIETTTAAAAGAAADMPADFRVSLTNAPGENAYPIASFTWLLVYREQPNEAKGRALVKFLWWATHEGQRFPASLLYAPLPAPVVAKIEARIRQITFAGKPLLAAR